MSDTIQVIKERRSVRKYQDRRVPQEVIDRIVEAGTYAPTGMGKQSPIILQIKNDMVRDELSKRMRKSWESRERIRFMGRRMF